MPVSMFTLIHVIRMPKVKGAIKIILITFDFIELNDSKKTAVKPKENNGEKIYEYPIRCTDKDC